MTLKCVVSCGVASGRYIDAYGPGQIGGPPRAFNLKGINIDPCPTAYQNYLPESDPSQCFFFSLS